LRGPEHLLAGLAIWGETAEKGIRHCEHPVEAAELLAITR